MKVVIAARDVRHLASLRDFLQLQSSVDVVGQGRSLVELSEVSLSRHPDLVVTGDLCDGDCFAAAEAVHVLDPSCAVVVMIPSATEHDRERAAQAEAAVADISEGIDALLDAIDSTRLP